MCDFGYHRLKHTRATTHIQRQWRPVRWIVCWVIATVYRWTLQSHCDHRRRLQSLDRSGVSATPSTSARPSWKNRPWLYSASALNAIPRSPRLSSKRRSSVRSAIQIVCFHNFFLRKGGYVFIGVSQLYSLLVSRIAQKLLSRFSQSSVERWHMWQGRNDYIFVVIRVTLL